MERDGTEKYMDKNLGCCYAMGPMGRDSSIRSRPGKKPGEFILELPPAWELRLRRILREQLGEALPDPHEPGISRPEREARRQARRRQMQLGICRFLAELVTADIIGREVALATRSYYGVRRGTLREEVESVLRELLLQNRTIGPVSPTGLTTLQHAKRKG
ncbi:MAG: hypothetical protein KatS3mg077_0453 [Candidatus Binatia bacterium]|nr:MAG: hypothetical protein KatS3mg077_0453 [Candidatus Binatia bacterium]